MKILAPVCSGWANYFTLGQVSPAYKTVDMHATRRLRQWFRRKHKVRSGSYVRFSDEWLRETCGRRILGQRPETFRERRHDPG